MNTHQHRRRRTKRGKQKQAGRDLGPTTAAPICVKRIVTAVISPLPKTLFDKPPTVTVKLSDGTEQTLFTFYADEIAFTPEELVGLTRAEAVQLKARKEAASKCKEVPQ